MRRIGSDCSSPGTHARAGTSQFLMVIVIGLLRLLAPNSS
jgi:hypothetical protein